MSDENPIQHSSSFDKVVSEATGPVVGDDRSLVTADMDPPANDDGTIASEDNANQQHDEKENSHVVNSNSMYDYMSTIDPPTKSGSNNTSPSSPEEEELQTVMEEIKNLDTCPTTDSYDGLGAKAKGNGASSSSSSSGRKWFYKRRYWLICFALLILVLAIVIATILSLDLLGGDEGQESSASASLADKGSSMVDEPEDIPVVASNPNPSPGPTSTPSLRPTHAPSASPTFSPTLEPTTVAPTISPVPTASPTIAPSGIPTAMPSGHPTGLPSSSPTGLPTSLPTLGPTGLPSAIPTLYPTATPSENPTISAAPTMSVHILLNEMLSGVSPPEVLSDMSTPQGRARFWMAEEDTVTLDILSATLDAATSDGTAAPADMENVKKVLDQRFAIVALDFSMHSGSEDALWSFPRLHECLWPGIKCNSDNEIREINWSRKDLDGYIAPELQLLTNLRRLDVAQNELNGFVDAFWLVPELKQLYAFENKFSGTIGEEVGQMTNLEQLYLGHNDLSGTIPSEITSLRGLRYLILHYNSFEGPLPNRLRLRNIFLLDISHNNIDGELPDMSSSPSIRHYHADHNQLTGSIPSNYNELGNRGLFSLFLNDNQLTGELPSGNWHDSFPHRRLTNFDVSNNNLSGRVPGSLCVLSVYEEGETVEFRADCDICRCNPICRAWCD